MLALVIEASHLRMTVPIVFGSSSATVEPMGLTTYVHSGLVFPSYMMSV